MQKRRKSGPARGTSSNPYKRITRIPKEIESAASLWLDFFQQFCEMVVDSEYISSPVVSDKDKLAVDRARILADHALTAFQERFPGVHP